MEQVFEISWTGQPRASMEELGISCGPLTLENQGVDEMPLSFRWDGASGPVIAARDIVKVWRNGVCILSGPATDTSFFLKERKTELKVMGAGHFLESSRWTTEYAGIGPIVPFGGAVTYAANYDMWRYWMQSKLTDVMTVPNAWPAYMADATMRSYPMRSGSCAVNLRAMMQWIIWAGYHFDYSGTLPSLVLSTRDSTPRVWATNLVADVRDFSPRKHLTPESVELRIMLGFRGGPDLDVNGNLQYYTDTNGIQQILYLGLSPEQSAKVGDWRVTTPWFARGADLAIWKQLSLLVLEDDVTGGSWWNSAVADWVLAQLQEPIYEGEIELQDDCNSPVNPGDTVSLSGYVAAWEGARTIVQKVVRDWSRGVTQVTVGARLAMQDLDTLQRRWVAWSRCPWATASTRQPPIY